MSPSHLDLVPYNVDLPHSEHVMRVCWRSFVEILPRGGKKLISCQPYSGANSLCSNRHSSKFSSAVGAAKRRRASFMLKTSPPLRAQGMRRKRPTSSRRIVCAQSKHPMSWQSCVWPSLRSGGGRMRCRPRSSAVALCLCRLASASRSAAVAGSSRPAAFGAGGSPGHFSL